jgi:tetratricopeptide (TPR) repeat protein
MALVADEKATNEEVSAALGRVLDWPEIARSAQLAGFLDYIVQRTLSGGAASIKAYSIAVDVLGRSADFDPQADPIVRVQARRLRSLLKQYYATEGAAETVRIDLPTGRYIPEFVRLSPSLLPEMELQESPAVRRGVGAVVAAGLRRLPSSWPILAQLTGLASLVALAVTLWGHYNQDAAMPIADPIEAPVLVVTELQSLTGAEAGHSRVAGLAVELVTDLDKFEAFDVRYGGTAEQAADYVLSGIVRREEQGLQYSAILTEVASNDVIWNKAIVVGAAEAADPDLLNSVSGQLSRTLGSPRGPLHQRVRELLLTTPSLAGRETLYLCRVLFDLYRERSNRASADRARSCYVALPGEDRASGQALAAMASLLAEAGAGVQGDAAAREQNLLEARNLLDRAIEVAPLSGFVWEQRARFLTEAGEDQAAAAAYASAQQLNPNSNDALAARALHLWLQGDLESADDLSQLTLEYGRRAPRWYFGVPALAAYRRGEFQVAATYARSYGDADRELGPILVVMAAQAIGDDNLVASYLPRVLDTASFRATGILTRLRQRIADESLIRDIRQSLLSAGLEPSVLNASF